MIYSGSVIECIFHLNNEGKGGKERRMRVQCVYVTFADIFGLLDEQ